VPVPNPALVTVAIPKDKIDKPKKKIKNLTNIVRFPKKQKHSPNPKDQGILSTKRNVENGEVLTPFIDCLS